MALSAPATAQDLDCSDTAYLPQIALNECAARDYAQWDARLNAVYQQVMATSDAARRERIRAAQRAWIPYRDLTCDMEAADAFGGTIAPLVQFSCLSRLTERRTLDLQSYLPR